MKHGTNGTRTMALKMLAKGIWKMLCLVLGACCRVAGSFLAVTVAFVVLYTQFPRISGLLGFTAASEITDTVIYEQLNAISELAVYEYRYENHVDCTNIPQLLGHNVWATDHWFAFDYSGVIKVGCDFNEISILFVDPASKSVIIHMPKVAVLSNEISINMETYKDRNNVCNPLQPREVLEYLYSRREPEQEKAIFSGVLELGTENAKTVISLAIRSLGYETVFR